MAIESVESQTSITDRTPVLAKGRGKSGMLLHKGALITPMCRALFGLSPRCEAPIKQHCLIGVAQIAQLVAVHPQRSCGRFSSNTLTVREERG